MFTFPKNETLASWHNWLLSNWGRLLNWKDLELSHRPLNCSKDSWKLLPLYISISWSSLVTSRVLVYKMSSKIRPVSRANTHHDVTEFENNGIAKNTKTWISWERNIFFLRNEKILNLYLKWHILRSYRSVTEVTFNSAHETFFVIRTFLPVNFFWQLSIWFSFIYQNKF